MKSLVRHIGFYGGILSLVLCARLACAGVTEAEFNRVLDKLQKVYSPQVSANGKALTFQREWADDTVNATARNWGDRYLISIYGGIARHTLTTTDSLAGITCHELGFLFGGEPRAESPADWSSVVGQADYYSTAKCMKRYLADEDNIAFVRAHPAPPIVSSKCAQAFQSEADRALCERTTLAGIAIAELLGGLSNTKADIGTPSQERPDKTVIDHPSVQCRLDTFFAGALCDANTANDEACADGTLGARPRCWFVP